MSGAINLHPDCRGDDYPGLIGAGQERFECDETDDTCDESSKGTPLVLENLHSLGKKLTEIRRQT